MGNYFKSSDIQVYPCSYRGANGDTQINPKARMLTEEGLTHLGGGKKLAENYVLNHSESTLEIVLAGYYFKILNINDYTLANTYLNIQIESKTTGAEEQTFLSSLYNNANGILDTKLGDAYYFTGLSYSVASEGNVSLKVFNASGKVIDNTILPEYDTALGTFKIHGNEVNGERSTAFGTGTSSNRANQFVVGENNETSTGALFIVGKGTEEEKSNVFETGSGTTKIKENAEITGTADIDGKVCAKDDLDITKNIKVGGTANITGAATLSDTLTVKKSGSFTEKVTIGDTVEIDPDGQAEFKDLVSIKTDKISLQKPTNITGDVDIKGDTTVTGTLKIKDNDKNIDITKDSITADNALTINGVTITKTGCITTKKTITATGNITGGSVEIKGSGSFGESVTAKSGKTDTDNSENKHVAILSDLLPLIYPIGSIYSIDAEEFEKDITSSTPTYKKDSKGEYICPIQTLLGGKWKRIEEKFLYASKNTKSYEGGSNKAYYVPQKNTSSSTISIGQPHVPNISYEADSGKSDYTYGEHIYRWNKKFNESPYVWLTSTAAGQVDTGKWAVDDLVATYYTGKGDSGHWTNAVITKFENDKIVLNATGMSVDYHVAICSSDRRENNNDEGAYRCCPLLPTTVGDSISYTTSYWTNIGNIKFSEDDIMGASESWPNTIQINMNHRHSAQINITTESNIQGCTEVTAANRDTANMPAYRRVYSWKRTE